MKQCLVCKNPIDKTGHNAKYCSRCSKERHLKSKREYAKKIYWKLKTLRSNAVGVFVPLIVLSFLFPTHTQAIQAPMTREVILSLANQQRYIPLRFNEKLNTVAQAKAEDMANRKYFSHTTPEGNKVWIDIQKSNYSYLTVGENLALGWNNPIAMMEAWKKSPSHNYNLINHRYRETGIGIAQRNGTYYIVHLFAQPQ